MTDKTYNNLSELYNTIPSEEAKKYSNHDMEKSRIPNLRNNIDVEPEGYFDDETAGQKRTDNYENIEKVENIVTEVVADDKLILVRTHSYVGLAHEAPKFSQDNEFILHGYRVNFHTCETIAKSLCLCHNETVNVWTHLVGALFTVILIIVTGITVGPYGYRINEPWRADHHKINFKKYSFPFYSSVPIFHNSRLFLSYLNMNLRKISNNTISDNLNHIDYNRTENFFIKSIDDYSSLFDDINEMEEDINCASCIEDFVRNMFTIKEFVEDTINYMDVINEKKAGLFNDSIRDKLISFQNIIDKFILKMIKKVKIFYN